jgi:hypothetical protein
MKTASEIYARSRPQGSYRWARRMLVSAVVWDADASPKQPHMNSRHIVWEGRRYEYDGRSFKQRVQAHAYAAADLAGWMAGNLAKSA